MFFNRLVIHVLSMVHMYTISYFVIYILCIHSDLISTSTRTLESHVATVTEERRVAAEIASQLQESARLIAEEQARRRRRIALYIHSDVVEKSPVGPIHFTGESTIAEIESKVYQWVS